MLRRLIVFILARAVLMVDEVSCGGVNLKVQVAGTCTGPPASIPVSVAAKENDHPTSQTYLRRAGHIEAKERAVRSALSLDEAIARMEIFDEGDDSTMKAGKAASPKVQIASLLFQPPNKASAGELWSAINSNSPACSFV